MARPVKMTVCGSCAASQLIAGLAASRPNFEVTVLTLESKAADTWNKALKPKDSTMIINFPRSDGSMFAEKGRPKSIVDSTSGDFITESEVIVMATPPSTFDQYLKAIKEKIKKGTVFIGLPGCSGFEYHFRSVLGDLGEQCTLVNLETFPWQFSVVNFGVQVDVKSTLRSLLAATVLGTSPPRRGPLSTLQLLVGGEVGLRPSSSFVSVMLSPFRYLVPGLMYGRFKDWDGKGLEDEPALFAEVDDKTADLLEGIAAECLKVTEAMNKEKTEAKLGDCKSLSDWLVEYKNCISDNSTLVAMLKTNCMLGDSKQPMQKKERKTKVEFIPDFEETLPDYLAYGLVVIRGVAEILAVKTPRLDELIAWCQEKTKKVFLKDGKLVSDKTIKETSSPQRFDIKTVNGLLLIKDLPVDPTLAAILGEDEKKEGEQNSAESKDKSKPDSKEKPEKNKEAEKTKKKP